LDPKETKGRLGRKARRESKALPDLKGRGATWAKLGLRDRRDLKVLPGKRETKASKARQVLLARRDHLEKKASKGRLDQPVQWQRRVRAISTSLDRIPATRQVAR
jgi:hypothetical protein